MTLRCQTPRVQRVERVAQRRRRKLLVAGIVANSEHGASLIGQREATFSRCESSTAQFRKRPTVHAKALFHQTMEPQNPETLSQPRAAYSAGPKGIFADGTSQGMDTAYISDVFNNERRWSSV
jgi:hypothetical protein